MTGRYLQALALLAAFMAPLPAAALCLRPDALEKLHEEVFAGRELLPLEAPGPTRLNSGESSYLYARRGDVALVRHQRPNYHFDYIVTLLDQDALIEARYRAEAQTASGAVEGSFVIVLHDGNAQDYAVICGAEDVGPLVVDPIAKVLDVLRAQTD